MLVRERRPSDMDTLLAIAEVVHGHDGYPRHLPDGDYRTFLLGHETLGAWVADDEGEVIGQVALHPRSSAPVMRLAATALGVPMERLGVVARLLVRPGRRREGVGAQLLERAAREAMARGLVPILDVVVDLAAAVSLYERHGWVYIGHTEVTFRDGPTVHERVYVAPPQLLERDARHVSRAGG